VTDDVRRQVRRQMEEQNLIPDPIFKTTDLPAVSLDQSGKVRELPQPGKRRRPRRRR
jgi:hypothetical protein